MITYIINYIIKFVPLLLSTIIAFVSLFPASTARLKTEITEQAERIAVLEEAYLKGEIAPVDEALIYSGDLEGDLKAGIKFNELSFIGTHNSYQTPALEELKTIYRNLSYLTFGIVPAEKTDFWSETLTDQLNCGIRSLEMDIETFDRDGEVSFTCMHKPYTDMTTSCYDFALAMKEISMWSDNNPNHLPITILIEPKDISIPLKDMKSFNVDYAKELDEVLRKSLGKKLFTPADMLRDYSSFGEMRMADDWCKVEDMLGKVVVLLHECDVTEKYISIDPTVKTQAMFPMLREKDIHRDCTSFILCNKPEELLRIINEVNSNKIMVRTRADKFTEVSDENRANAFASGANIISTDFPVRTDLTADSYFVSFEEYATVKGNK